MGLEREYLDTVLVPLGLFLMIGYHLLLLYRFLKLPETTVIGYENHNKKAWVQRMMQGNPNDPSTALQVISSSISASTYLASLSIALSSLIGTWIGSSPTTPPSKLFMKDIIYGNTSVATASVKYISILFCFMLGFMSFVQSTRYFLHASFLISSPDAGVPTSYVEKAVIRGSNFWSLGLRAHYFAATLLLWIFGPIPMLVGSISMVIVLHFLDTNSTPLLHYCPSAKPPSRHMSRAVSPGLDPMLLPQL
ncbi:hypothetical protein AMTRI_Chr01g133410 [Amborella trichopoda]